MSQSGFLMDANSFIAPYRGYYSFDFAPGFWTQMEQNIKDSKVFMLDVVRDEILRGNDELTIWIKALEIGKLIDHREGPIISYYSQVLQYIQSSPYYKESALTEWAKGSVADPWIIATAIAYSCPIVTFEIANTNPSIQQPWKMAKIPEVANHFGVATINLFSMMRELGFKL